MIFENLTNFVRNNLTIILIAIVVAIIYHLIFKNWWFFSNKNVKFVRGYPIVGSFYKMMLGIDSFAVNVRELYSTYPDETLIGIYQLMEPVYLICDPDLMKQITVQDFDHFPHRKAFFPETKENSVLARQMFVTRGRRWKDFRNTLSPAFTANKMRLMFGLIQESTFEFVNGLKQLESEQVYELKDLYSRLTTNIIATCSFGLRVDTIKDRDSEFYLTGKRITNMSGIQAVKFKLFEVIPKIMDLLSVQFFDKRSVNYLRDMVLSTIEYREKNNIYRPDMINLLMEARNGTLQIDSTSSTENPQPQNGNFSLFYTNILFLALTTLISSYFSHNSDWHDDDLIAQCVGFLFGAFETNSALLCFMSHELACNPDIQERLYNEIMETEKLLDGNQLNYEALHKMKYLDMVITESLRKWPSIATIDREVAHPYEYTDPKGNKIIFSAGDFIIIPIYAFHMDPKYWPEPERFDPERFSDENKANLNMNAYLPFGSGQRNCIASRFATMVAKTIFYYVLRDFRIEKCDKTPEPLLLRRQTLNMTSKDGFWVKLRSRKSLE